MYRDVLTCMWKEGKESELIGDTMKNLGAPQFCFGAPKKTVKVVLVFRESK